MTAPKYLPRSWWADSDWPRGGAALVATDLWREGNVSHYPGRSSAFGTISLSSLRSNLRGWWDWHVNGRGWSDIGYQVCVALTTDGPVVVDLRGIGRVPAAHASASNPRANWHGGATLWVVGNTEQPDPELIDAYRHFRHTVWLPRWPTATKTTGHRLVPGTSTGCPGDPIVALIRSGTLTKVPTGEDDMPLTTEDVRKIWKTDGILRKPSQGYEDSTNMFWTAESMLRSAQLYARLGYIYGKTLTSLVKAQQPFLEAAAAREGMTAEQVQEVAAACAAAIPDGLADDVVDELGERLSGTPTEP